MKQNISIKQLNELSDKGREKYQKWCRTRLPATVNLLSIGQMLEFIEDQAEINSIVYFRTEPWWHIELTNRSIGKGAEGHIDITETELSDALWEACKEVLND